MYRYTLKCTITLITLISALFVSQLAAASPEQNKPASAGDPIVIGSILILSGEGSSWGNASRNGMDMAIEKINADGGVLGRKLVADHQDDRGEPPKTATAFQNLVNAKGVKLIIGPTWSNVGLAVMDMAAHHKVLMISPTLGVEKFNESSPYLFNTWPHDVLLSTELADYVYNKGHRKVALVGAEQVWVKDQTNAFKTRFEELGGKIVFLSEQLPGTTDLRTDALKIRNNKEIDAVVSTTDGNIIGSLTAKALKEIGVTLPLYSISLDQAAIDAAQGGFENLEFLTSFTPTTEFKKAYEARCKTSIDIGADSAYDAVMLLAAAIKETKSADTTLLAQYLSSVKEYQGVSGNLKSDGKRAFTKDFVLKKVSAGKAVTLERH